MKLFAAAGSLLLASLFAVGCDSETNPDATGGQGGSSGGAYNGDGGAGNGGAGGEDAATGGAGGTTCAPSAPFCLSACQAPEGPKGAARSTGVGAFKESSTWLEGWTNWSTNSSQLTEAQQALQLAALDPDNAATHALSEDIAVDRTLTADQAWFISGTVHVLDGVTLTIEPGTLIIGDYNPGGTLVVSRGGRLVAEGTADAPIIMTSAAVDGQRGAGQWGGLVLLGRASNFQGDDVQVNCLGVSPLNQHGPGAGEADDGWDCGSLAYVRVEFAGVQLNDELSGFTVGSCGIDTQLSYIQSGTTLVDGFEFIGGAFDADHLVVNNAGDDLFDFDAGWRGTLDTFFGRHVTPWNADPNGLEWDSSNAGAPETPGDLPATNAHAVNGTLCGSGHGGSAGEPVQCSLFGAVLREKVTGSIQEVVFVGFAAAFDVRDNFLADGAGPAPKVSVEASSAWDNVMGVAYEEDDAIVRGTQACTDEPNEYLCDDDFAFDERQWFMSGIGNFWDGDGYPPSP